MPYVLDLSRRGLAADLLGVMSFPMQLKSTVIAVSAVIAHFSMSGNAHASCAAHSVVLVSHPANRILAIGRWQARVANRIGDLYSDWSYARNRHLVCHASACKISGIPCNAH